MGTSDGTVQGLVGLLTPGAPEDQCNIVLVAEGYTAAQLDDFRDLCEDIVATLQAEPWFATAGGPLNLYRLDVASDESGADDPTECGGDGSTADTYFDAQYCNGSPPIRRCLSGDEDIVAAELDAVLPQWHAAGVVVNTDSGGCASGNIFFTNAGSGARDTVLHELGHAAFGLADEYDSWSDCASENPRTTSPEPNVSRSATAATLKWRHLRSPGVPIPTQLNPDCSMCDTSANVLPDDTAIGMYEGARYEHCDMFRPAYTCRMRRSSQGFCRVCAETIAIDLGGFAAAAPILEVMATALDFGDVGTDLTLVLSFEVRNVRSGHPMPLTVTLGTPTAGFAYAPGTETTFILPAPIFEAHTVRRVYVSFTAPTSPATVDGELSVATTDGQSQTVELTGRSVVPPPVDSVLVVDRSGSMGDPTGVPGQVKIDQAIEAGELYASLLKETDRIGVVRYNNASGPSDVLLTMRTAGDLESGAGRAAVRAALDPANLAPAGMTSIGSGIINGSDLLDTGTADARALIVLTDGRQNTGPDVGDSQAVVVTRSPAQRVFAVGLGLNQLGDTLEAIATVTNGVAQVTGDLVDEREFLLQKLYVQILSDVSDEAFVRDPVDWLRPGQCRATQVSVSEIDVACDFIIAWRPSPDYPKYLRMWLEAPDGTVIDQSSPSPAVDVVVRERHAFFRVRFPFDPAKPMAHVGLWRVWVEILPGHEFLPTLRYTVMAKARSNLLLGGRVRQGDRSPGSPMTVELEPTLFGRPVTLDDPVAVTVTRPDGVTRAMTLAPDGHGTYRATYTDTPLVGAYRVEAEVAASSPAGFRVTRYRTMTGLVLGRDRGQGGTGGPGSGGTGNGGQDDGGGCGCDDVVASLRVLARTVVRCCRRRPHPCCDTSHGPRGTTA